jgi:hypothetical protein
MSYGLRGGGKLHEFYGLLSAYGNRKLKDID